ncbi:nucleotidyltransferase family protein [Larkinella sp. VNQ87]|uniref:nucleotidyltransferase family protein n=1 Tax=Larkinella sp. VNQ87 TaxID=3400921 RepID=UPI003C0DAC4C
MQSQALFQTIQTYLLQNQVQKAAIFGSFARGEETSASDIDLLIEADGLTLFDILRFEEELSDLTKRPVDIVEYRALKPSIRNRVMAGKIDLI